MTATEHRPPGGNDAADDGGRAAPKSPSGRQEEASSADNALVEAAIDLFDHGLVPVLLQPGKKVPSLHGWPTIRYSTADEVRSAFVGAAEGSGLGVLLGNGLADVDLDSSTAIRAAPLLLPETPVTSGHESKTASHWWYRLADATSIEYVKHTGPDGTSVVEVRADSGHQTVIPPSTHPSGEAYQWGSAARPWDAPLVAFRELELSAALLSLVSVLADAWPEEGSRHDAYLALAGTLLHGCHQSHSMRVAAERAVHALASLTGDRDGAGRRVSESIPSTIQRLERGENATGWPTLSNLLLTEDPAPVIKAAQRAAAHLRVALDLPVEDDPILQSESVRTWREVDLSRYLDGTWTAQEPTVGRRSDGVALFYRGRTHSVASETEAGKTWLALAAAADEMLAGEHVVYLDFEDEAGGAASRLLALQLDRELIGSQFHYVHPEGPLTADEWKDFGELLHRVCPSLVVLDGMTNAMNLHDLDPLSNADVSRFDRRVIRPIVKAGEDVDDGPATVVLDHVTKAREGRGRYQIGAVHKLNSINGAAYVLKAVDPILPGRVGHSSVLVAKDRPGRIKVHCTGKPDSDGLLMFGDLVVRSAGTDLGAAVEVELVAGPDGGPGGTRGLVMSAEATRDTVRAAQMSFLMSKVSEVLKPSLIDPAKAMSRRKIGEYLRFAGVRHTSTNLGTALAGLEKEGHITATPHQLLKPFDYIGPDRSAGLVDPEVTS